MSRFALAALAAVALLCAGGITTSGADYVASSPSPANSFAAAADFNTVDVALTAPAGPLRGSVALAATATSERGIERVRFESSPAGADAWTVACDDDTAPYSCDFDTAAVADGSRDLRAVALDSAGYIRTSTATVPVDNTKPVAALADPGYLQGSETLTATATDGGSGVASLALAYRPAGGGAWTSLCTGASSPLSCALATAGLADGAYELRATATDAAGNGDAAVLTRTVDNNAPSAAVAALPAVVRGTIAIGFGSGDGAGSGVKQVTGQIRPAGGSWTTLCVDTSAPYACAGVDTTLLADGDYEVRAVAEDDAGLTATSGVSTTRVDNTPPPAPALNAVAANLSGTVSLSGAVAGGTADVAQWVVRYRPAGGGAWADACSDAGSPYSCNWDTTAVADALYDVRAVTVDAAGNETASATQANRRVDNNGPTLTAGALAQYVSGTVALSATATDPAGVSSVTFERRPAGGTAWTSICTDPSSPYSCSWNTTTLADGAYEVRISAADTTGRTTTTTLTTRVDNTAPAGSAVDAGNGGATAGLLEAGDWVRLTWTEQIAPGSVLAGWDGSATAAIRVQLTDGNNNDEMSFWDATGSTKLPLADATNNLRLNANFVTSSAWFDATMAQNGASITVTLGAHLSGTLTTANPANMRWRTSTGATDLAGNAVPAANVNESNPADRDF